MSSAEDNFSVSFSVYQYNSVMLQPLSTPETCRRATSVRDVGQHRLLCVTMAWRVGRSVGARRSALFAGSMFFAACSSGVNNEVIPLAAPGTAETATSVARETTTSATLPSTTTTASTITVAPPASTTSEPEVPTTSVEALRDEIQADLNTGRAAFIAAAAHPIDPTGPGLDQWYEGRSLEILIAGLSSFVDSGQAVRVTALTVEHIEVQGLQLVGDNAAVAVYCLSTNSVVYQVTDDQIINDDAVSRLTSSTLRLVDGTWRIASSRRLSSFEVLRCE